MVGKNNNKVIPSFDYTGVQKGVQEARYRRPFHDLCHEKVSRLSEKDVAVPQVT